MAVVQGVELVDVVIDAGESAKPLKRPGMVRLLALVDAGAVGTVIQPIAAPRPSLEKLGSDQQSPVLWHPPSRSCRKPVWLACPGPEN
jgi:hypothetical protein